MSFVDSSNQRLGDAEAPYVLIQSATRHIGTIFPDVTVREDHSDTDTITNFPVETGTPISDHVFANPKLIQIACGFSDASNHYAGYVQDAYQDILAIKALREPFDVSTGKRFYQNMLFGDISVVTDEGSEFALMVTARLQEVIISQTGGSSNSPTTQSNQEFPSETAPETNVGNQALLSAPNASLYSDYEGGFGAPSGIGHA